jgi:hypothetical protein
MSQITLEPDSESARASKTSSRPNHIAPPRLIFFCIGCQKTGSTLLARVLDQHPKIACMWESYSFDPFSHNSIFLDNSKSAQSHGFAPSDVQRWGNWWRAQLRPSPLKRAYRYLQRRAGGQARTSRYPVEAFKHVFMEALTDFAFRCNAEVVGDKTPLYLHRLALMLEAFPKAKYIYGVRDPRAVWNSAQRFKNRQRGDEILNELIEKDELVQPYLGQPNFLTVRYEDLVLESHETCRRLYEFLDCDYSPDYLTYQPETDPYPNRWDWIPEARDQFAPRHATKWREQMARDEIQKVNEKARAMLERHRYAI